MVIIVLTPVPHELNDVGYSQPLLMYLPNVILIPKMLNKYIQVKKNCYDIVGGYIN